MTSGDARRGPGPVPERAQRVEGPANVPSVPERAQRVEGPASEPPPVPERAERVEGPAPARNPRELAASALGPAASAAFPPGQYIGQECFATADGIRSLARAAGVTRGTRVLDVCCGAGGPGRLLAREFGCRVHGIDADPAAVSLARRTVTDGCTYAVASAPPLPPGPWDVVLLLETLLAFPDKPTLLRAVARALSPTGRFACTLEEGMPLTAAERAAMPHADTVWPVPLGEFEAALRGVGLVPDRVDDVTADHLFVVRALAREFDTRRDTIAAAVGDQAIDDLIRSHGLWAEWMASGRIRKFAVVAVRAA